MARTHADDREENITGAEDGAAQPVHAKAHTENSGELAKLAASSNYRTQHTPAAAVDAQTGPRKMPQPGARVVGGSTGDAAFHPTISFDPANVKAIEHYAEFEGYLQPAVHAFSNAFEHLKQVADARAKAENNKAWNDWQKLLIVGKEAEKRLEHIAKTFDKAHSDLSKAAEMLEQQLSQPLTENAATGSINAEIRAHVKALSADDRMKFISAALREGDTRTLTAVLGAPAFLSGLGSEAARAFLRQYHEQRSAEVVRRLTATRAAIAMIEKKHLLAVSQMEKAMKGTFTKLRQVREADSEARKALLMTQNDVGAHDFLAG